MATWGELVMFIRREYEVIGYEQDEVTILFRYQDDEDDDRTMRTQMVAVVRENFDRSGDWVQIASPIARLRDGVDLRALLQEVGNTTVVGGVAIIGDYVMLRHSLPLINLDLNEFIDPLVMVTRSADRMERWFVGGDRL